MLNLQKLLMLTDKGHSNLKKAILACTISNFTILIPPFVTIQIMMEIIKPLMNESISWTKIWILFVIGIMGMIIIYFANRNDYEATYVSSYLESENTRISIAEKIRKLPMHVFNSKDLTELTTNMMDDVMISEQVLSHIIPQMISNFISIFVVTVSLSFFDWRMALAMFITVPVAFLLIFGSKGVQNKLGAKHAKSKLYASDKVQEYLEGIKVIKACNLDGNKFSALENALKDMRNKAIKNELITGTIVTGAQVILQSGVGLVVYVGVQLLLGGQIDFIPLLMFLLIVTRVYGPFLVELFLLPELFYNQIAVNRIKKLMAIELMTGEEKEVKNFDIEFSDVHFGYHDETKVIKGFN